MCEFKVGDEVVCVAEGSGYPHPDVVYVVSQVLPPLSSHNYGLRLTADGPDRFDDPYRGWMHTMFRKVQKRNSSLSIEAFLTIKPGFEEPKRVTEPKPKRQNA